MTGGLIDPREFPDPPLRVQPRPPAPDVTELLDLLRLCREGRVYEVEAWIKSGRPLQAIDYRHGKQSHRLASPLRVAIETEQFDLARLLLCNGFLPDLEKESLLEPIVHARAKEYLALLLAWGADPTRVSPLTVLDTYDVNLMESFWGYGVDLTKDHALALRLSRETSNKPGYGWAKRHRDDPRVARDLAMALGDAVMEGREKAVLLLLWAGADPHRKVPSLQYSSPEEEDDPDCQSSAVEWAASCGKGPLLARLKPDPQLDDFDKLWSSVHEMTSFNVLAGIHLPDDWSRMLLWNLSRALSPYSSQWEARQVVEAAAGRFHARLTTADSGRWSSLRREVARAKNPSDARWFLMWMKKSENCDPAIFAELTNTSSMKKKLVALGLAKQPVKGRRGRNPPG